MNPNNAVSVTTLIKEIISDLRFQTSRWRKASELLNQAEAKFGFGTDEMKQTLEKTDISSSKTSKLINVAQDDWIRQNSRIFDTLSA